MICLYCNRSVKVTQVIVGPEEQPFCSSGCRDNWIWRNLPEPSEQAFTAAVTAARRAQYSFLTRLKRALEKRGAA